MGDETKKPDIILDLPIKRILVATVGATLGGSFSVGARVIDVATSLQGGLGILIGYTAGDILRQTGLVSDSDYVPLAGALAVTLLAGGVVDRATFGLIGGAYIGTFFA